MDYTTLIAKKDADFNEEQTKHAMVLPILDRILGWDIYDDLKIIPEFTADTPGKNGEKVDYALDIQGDGKPEVLIEVKPLGSRLNSKGAAQLYRYFGMTEAKIGVLTDGYRWMLYSDLDRPNVMDDSPFLDFDLEDLATRKPLEKLFSYLSFSNFDADYIRTWGEVARDTERLRDFVKSELANPSDDFSRYFYSKLHPGSRATSNRLEAFRNMLIEVLSERDAENEKVDAIGMKSTFTEAPKPSKARKKSYIQSDQGHKGEVGNLKNSWISFWSEVNKSDTLYEKLLEIVVSDDSKGLLSLDEKPYYDSIGREIYIYSNIGAERRSVLLDRLSELVGINSKIVYVENESTDVEDDEEVRVN